MAFSRGPYAKQANLPPPRVTRLPSSASLDASTRRFVHDTDGNAEAMRDTAQRVYLLVAYAVEQPTGFITARDQTRIAQRVRDALAGLVREGAITDVRVVFEESRWGTQRFRVVYFDKLRSVPNAVQFGPTWTDTTWEAGTPQADGTLVLASWMSFSCATSGTTAQTSASTLQTGFAANAPRGFSRDGSTWALLPEPGTTNRQSEQDLANFDVVTGTPTISSATGPDGAAGNYQVVDDDGGVTEYIIDTNAVGVLPSPHTMSVWAYVVALSGGSAQAYVREVGVATYATPLNTSSTTAGWGRYVATYSGSVGVTASEVHIVPSSSGTGTLRASFIQVEDLPYSTSFISGTRAASSLALESERLMPRGYFDIQTTIAPPFAHSVFATEWDLLHFDGADHRLYFDGSDDKIKLLINGTEIEVGALTWSIDTAITVRASHLPTGLSLTVSGALTGNGTASAGAVGRIAVPGSIYLGGDSSGTQHSCPVRSIASYAQAL